jgi:glycosyltransferase 2 family protein
MSRSVRGWGGGVGSVLPLAVLIWRLGTGPFLDGLRSVDGGALAAAAGITVVTTACYAWRWKIVARGLGVDLSLRAAVAAYYRSLFLNVTLPGGIVGDVHRGVSHGRDVSDVGRGLRSVAWERFAGQVVQVLLTVIVLLALPSPVRSFMPLVAIAVVVAVLGIVLVARARPDGARSAWARLLGGAAGDIRDGLLSRRAWPGIALASLLVVAGHAATFLIAAQTAGATAPASRMLPIVLLVMAAMVLPNVAGWGPREGVAAWVFGAAGLGAQRGVATAVVYGIMVLVASLPGAAVLVVSSFRRTRLPGGPNRRSESDQHVPDRPYTLLSCGMSIDCYVGSATSRRLELSNDADYDRVDAVRASHDAILVGAATVPNDNPRLLLRSKGRRDERTVRGLPPSPINVAVTERVELVRPLR